MGGKKDKKKKAKDPLKKAALAAKKDAKADKAALKRLHKERDRDAADHGAGTGSAATAAADDLDSILASYRHRTEELGAAAVVTPLATAFPCPPRGNFTWTLCPANGLFYLFGGEYYDGAENIVFDELLRWDPDAKPQCSDKDDAADAADADAGRTGQWTRILTPLPRPPPRCAHTTVHHDGALYVFGGERATADKYHHYKDLWKFDIKRNTWEELRARGGSPPAARSGHRAATWRRSMIVFGGFHEALRSDTRWFNDVHLFDFQTCIWTELKYSKLARVPPPRSACNMAVGTAPTEALYVTGGYRNALGGSKTEGVVHVDCWMLPLKPLVGAAPGAPPPAWERITRKGEYPSARAGAAAAVHRHKLLAFGGVLDDETDGHRMASVFYDDLFALDMERRRWFALRLKAAPAGGPGRRRRRVKGGREDSNTAAEDDRGGKADGSEGEEPEEGTAEDDDVLVASTKNEEAVSSGWELDQLRQDMFAFIDGEGNVVYEKIDDEEADGAGVPADGNAYATKEDEVTEEDGEEAATAKPTKDQNNSADAKGNNATSTSEQSAVEEPLSARGEAGRRTTDIHGSPAAPPASRSAAKPSGKIAASSVMRVGEGGLPAAVVRRTPLPRINCAAVVRNNTLYLYGGVLEVGDREVTLDDCWSLDLHKRDAWTCIWPGQMHRQVWKGVDSDNESYISSDQGGGADDDSSDGDVAAPCSFAPIAEGGGPPQDGGDASEEARKKTKKAAKKAKEKDRRRDARSEIAALKEQLGVDDGRRTPLAGESVADFYARTTEHWNAEATREAAAEGGEAASTKELRREGFRLARERYEELTPVLRRLDELEGAETEADEKKAAKKRGDKKQPKKERRR